MVAVFQETVHVDKVIKSSTGYIEKYKAELRSAGPELKFLGLAMPDQKSPLGWRPTPLLMEFIAKRKIEKKSKPLYEAYIMEQLISDYVFGYEADRGEGSPFAYFLLDSIGLRHYDGDTYWVTEDLHNHFFITVIMTSGRRTVSIPFQTVGRVVGLGLQKSDQNEGHILRSH